MKRYSGYLTMVVAILLVVIAGLATAFVSMIMSGMNSTASISAANSAYNGALTGIENGLYQLSIGQCNSSWSSIISMNNGEYQYNCILNNAITTTSQAILSNSSSIPLSQSLASAGLANFGAVQIDSEIIYYDNQDSSSNILSNVQRGRNGTTAASHTVGSTVSQSQYIIGGQAGSPSLTAPWGKVTLYQAVLNNLYFVAGINSANRGIILTYNNNTWQTSYLGPNSFSFQSIYMAMPVGIAVGYLPPLGASTLSSLYLYNGAWSLNTTSTAGIAFNAVSCDEPSNPSNCWVAGATQSGSHGFLYHSPSSFTSGGSNSLLGISCNNGACATVGSGNAYNFLVDSISPFTTSKNLSSSNDVDCLALNSCIAVENSGKIAYYNGTWGANIQLKSSAGPNQTNNLLAIDCPSTSICFIVGANGTIYRCSTVPPTAVSCVQQTAPGTLSLSDVSCISTTNCLTVSSTLGSTAYRYNGTNWTAITLPGSYSFNSVGHSFKYLDSVGIVHTIFHNY